MKELGRAKCYECDTENKVLVISRGNIYSLCKNCGYSEWEWAMGDNLDYLTYLAERYKVDLTEIKKAVGLL